MPRIPGGDGQQLSINQNVRGVNVNPNAFGAVDKVNAEIAQSLSSLGQNLFDKSKNIQVKEEQAQARADFTLEAQEKVDLLNKEFNDKGDFRGYKEAHARVMDSLRKGYDNDDKFVYSESRQDFQNFFTGYNARLQAKAGVHQTQNLTQQFITQRNSTFQKENRAIEAKPLPYNASAALNRHVSALTDINNQGGYFTPDQLDRSVRSASKQAFNSLMSGFETSKNYGQAKEFLRNKKDPHYKVLTEKLDSSVIAQWERRVDRLQEVDKGVKKRTLTNEIKNLKLTVGNITDPESSISTLERAIESSDFDDKKELLDELKGVRAADTVFRETKDSTLSQKLDILRNIEKGKASFFPQADKKQFNAAKRLRDTKVFSAALARDVKQMIEQPADYFAAQDPGLGQLADNVSENLTNVNAVKAYSEEMISMQQKRGIQEPKLLDKKVKESFKAVFTGVSPDLGADQVGAIQSAWGPQASNVFSELVDDGVSPLAASSLFVTNKESRFLILNNAQNAKEISKTFKETDFSPKEIKLSEGIAELKKVRNQGDTFDRGANVFWQTMNQNIQLETKRSLIDGDYDSIEEASIEAKKKIFDNNFDIVDGLALPKQSGLTVDTFEDFRDIVDDNYEKVLPKQTLDEVDEDNLKWVMDSTGIVLKNSETLGAAMETIKDKNGDVIKVSFEDIASGQALIKMFGEKPKKSFRPTGREALAVGRKF